MKSNPFVATYDNNGVFKWQTQLGSSSVFGYDVAAAFDASGDVIVSGDYDGGSLVVPLAVGGSATLANNNNSRDIFVVKLDERQQRQGRLGEALRRADWGPCCEHLGESAGGRLVRRDLDLGGNFDGSIDITGNVASKGGLDGFLAKLDGSGVASLALFQTGATGNGVSAITVDTSGNILVAGTTAGTTDLGGGPIVIPASGVSYLVKYSNAGIYQWAKTFDSTFPASISHDPSDNIFLAAYMYGDVDFGGGLLKLAGSGFFNPDMALAKLDATGGHLWSKSVGDGSAQDATGIATDPVSHGIVMGGSCQGTVDFGTGPITAGAASFDVCVAKFQP